eukprot:tig00020537_g10292.t1
MVEANSGEQGERQLPVRNKHADKLLEKFLNCPACKTRPPKAAAKPEEKSAQPAEPSADANAGPAEPPDAADIGRASWTLLHSIAAYYPEQPSEQEQQDMRTFMRLFAKFYPCGVCAEDMRKDVAANPPQTASRTAFEMWMCELHNRVNQKLGKPLIDCARVLQRWRGDH